MFIIEIKMIDIIKLFILIKTRFKNLKFWILVMIKNSKNFQININKRVV